MLAYANQQSHTYGEFNISICVIRFIIREYSWAFYFKPLCEKVNPNIIMWIREIN